MIIAFFYVSSDIFTNLLIREKKSLQLYIKQYTFNLWALDLICVK